MLNLRFLPICLVCKAAFAVTVSLTLNACGGGGSGGEGDPAPIVGTPVLDEQKNAAQQTAELNPSCQAISPFYYEIGDSNGVLIGEAMGDGSVKADTLMPIASSTKWWFGAYVAEIRKGTLTVEDVSATHMLSGYVSFDNLKCNRFLTVDGCFNAGSNATYTSGSDGRFHYDGGHFQHWGVENGLGNLSPADVASEFSRVLGNDFYIGFTNANLAGGGESSAADYAVFLRKLLTQDLYLAGMLGDDKTCTLPGICSTADYSPVAEAWSYSIGHWVEDAPGRDGAYSSPGAFGFYPWISSGQDLYGIVARYSLSLGTAASGSVQCGRAIREAYRTGTAQ